MGVWKGNAILSEHKCGGKVWVEWINSTIVIFRSYALIGQVLWIGETIENCPECGCDLHPFASKEWMEA